MSGVQNHSVQIPIPAHAVESTWFDLIYKLRETSTSLSWYNILSVYKFDFIKSKAQLFQVINHASKMLPDSVGWCLSEEKPVLSLSTSLSPPSVISSIPISPLLQRPRGRGRHRLVRDFNYQPRLLSSSWTVKNICMSTFLFAPPRACTSTVTSPYSCLLFGASCNSLKKAFSFRNVWCRRSDPSNIFSRSSSAAPNWIKTLLWQAGCNNCQWWLCFNWLGYCHVCCVLRML